MVLLSSINTYIHKNKSKGMSGLYLSEIYIYPVKSLGGISLQTAEVQQTGLQYDRRWMLVDESGQFISQRVCNQMALLQVNIGGEGLLVTHKNNLLTPLAIPFNAACGKEIPVSIWNDVCNAVEVSAEANQWFSHALNMPVRLVYMPASTQRFVETGYAKNNEIVSFADAYPLLVIAQSSLDDLNSRLEKPVLMNRFRPNFVISGGGPYCEDELGTFQMGDVTFAAVKPCSRCVLITVDQENASKGKEPLKTLATYRTDKNKVLFGQNLLHSGKGYVSVGDSLVKCKDYSAALHFAE